ncbi:MAG: orotate phosphoribosyltransferase [Methanocellales archaeon]|nr:orotate phosphoribosyltransferase [Methanocellales archaeon]MDD3291728.1 orotate phosphoribosyltransferase [Methanocellales archaeon]MDD5235078.1 orotate phosphoribosyltransferase [Methanocellales archaeon]MDD5485216.1 orotate phosphoribosyltransferase [Methanocellales archaeon]
MSDRELLKALKSSLKFGDFTLSSGLKSSYYVDKYIFETDPNCLEAIGNKISGLIPPGTKKLAAIELGSISLVAVASVKTKLPYVIVRKQKKGYATKKLIEGEICPGETVIVVEDVITTGSEAVRAVQTLRDHGAIVYFVLAVVDREEGARENLMAIGVSLVSIAKSSELLDQS